jgi:hypothetical protein
VRQGIGGQLVLDAGARRAVEHVERRPRQRRVELAGAGRVVGLQPQLSGRPGARLLSVQGRGQGGLVGDHEAARVDGRKAIGDGGDLGLQRPPVERQRQLPVRVGGRGDVRAGQHRKRRRVGRQRPAEHAERARPEPVRQAYAAAGRRRREAVVALPSGEPRQEVAAARAVHRVQPVEGQGAAGRLGGRVLVQVALDEAGAQRQHPAAGQVGRDPGPQLAARSGPQRQVGDLGRRLDQDRERDVFSAPAPGDHQRPRAGRERRQREARVGLVQPAGDRRQRGVGVAGAPAVDQPEPARGNAERRDRRGLRPARRERGRLAQDRQRRRAAGQLPVARERCGLERQHQRAALLHRGVERHGERRLVALALRQRLAVGVGEQRQAERHRQERCRQRGPAGLARQRQERQSDGRRSAAGSPLSGAQGRAEQAGDQDPGGQRDQERQQRQERVGPVLAELAGARAPARGGQNERPDRRQRDEVAGLEPAAPTRLGCRPAGGHQQQGGRHEPAADEQPDPAQADERVAQHVPGGHVGRAGHDPDREQAGEAAQHHAGKRRPAQIEQRKGVQLATPRAAPLEPPPLGGQVAPQRAGRQQDERQEQRRRLAADQEQPAGRGLAGGLCLEQGAVGRRQSEEVGVRAEPGRGPGLAGQQVVDRPGVDRSRRERAGPAVGAIDQAQRRQVGQRAYVAGDQERRLGVRPLAAVLVGHGGVRGVAAERQGRAKDARPDPHQVQTGRVGARERVAADLHHLAAGRRAGARRPSRGDPDPARRVVDGGELEQAPADAGLPEQGGADGVGGAELGQRRDGTPVDPDVAAGRRQAEPVDPKRSVGRRQLGQRVAQRLLAGDHRAAEHHRQQRRGHRHAEGHQQAAQRAGPRPGGGHRERREGAAQPAARGRRRGLLRGLPAPGSGDRHVPGLSARAAIPGNVRRGAILAGAMC